MDNEGHIEGYQLEGAYRCLAFDNLHNPWPLVFLLLSAFNSDRWSTEADDVEVGDLLVRRRQLFAFLVQSAEADGDTDTDVLVLVLCLLFALLRLSISIDDGQSRSSDVTILVPLSEVEVSEALLPRLRLLSGRCFSGARLLLIGGRRRLRSVTRRRRSSLVVKTAELEHGAVLELEGLTEPSIGCRFVHQQL